TRARPSPPPVGSARTSRKTNPIRRF
ncbi:uncharacterized protein METZ01_LOCUS461582, partial [marine metagenome]